MSRRRCPQHPDGCTKHPNPHPPAPVRRPGVKGRPRPQHQRRGSLERYVALQFNAGAGNPNRRRQLARREWWEARR